MAGNRGEQVEQHLPDNNKKNKGDPVRRSETKGAVPPRLVYLWHRIPGDKLIQVCFEWLAPWPNKYAIECHQGRFIVARASGLPWETVFEFLNDSYKRAGGNLSAWYQLVHERLAAEGGETLT